MTQKPGMPLTRAGRFWALFPVALIVSTTLGLLSMAAIAVHDPSFATEQDYYKKAVAWDQTQAQVSTNTRLGWKVELDTELRGNELHVLARVVDASGAPIRGATVKLEAFANARAARVETAVLLPTGDAGYGGTVALSQLGLWEFRLDVSSDGRHFTETLRRDVRAGGPS
ncbi:MAG: FixH family protein [Myxococcales bacterium]|nr:FixH family protein [Myxococcales bacterium]